MNVPVLSLLNFHRPDVTLANYSKFESKYSGDFLPTMGFSRFLMAEILELDNIRFLAIP